MHGRRDCKALAPERKETKVEGRWGSPTGATVSPDPPELMIPGGNESSRPDTHKASATIVISNCSYVALYVIIRLGVILGEFMVMIRAMSCHIVW